MRRKVPAFSGRSAAIHGVAVCSIVVPRHRRGPPLKAFPKILFHYITAPGKSQRDIFPPVHFAADWETRSCSLDLPYLRQSCHSRGIGLPSWQAIETRYPGPAVSEVNGIGRGNYFRFEKELSGQ